MRAQLNIRLWEFIANISISIVILYVLALQLLFQSGNILILFTIIALMASILESKSIEFGGIYLPFVICTTILSLLVTPNVSNCLSTVTIVVKVYIFFLVIINCMKIRNGFNSIRISTIIAGLYLSYMLIFNNRLSIELSRVTASDSINSNVVAASITVAIAMALFDITSCKNKLRSYLDIATILFMSSAVILTGTRKTFIAIIAFLVLYVLYVYKPGDAEYIKPKQRRFIVSVIAIAFILIFVKTVIDDSIIGVRFRETGYLGDRMREYYYMQAVSIFLENPICGLGWGGFEQRVGMYSHSTYGELIANTGILGSLIFLFQYLSIFRRGVNGIRRNDRNSKEYELILLSLYSILIVLGLAIGTTVFYEINLTICIGVSYAIIKNRYYEV